MNRLDTLIWREATLAGCLALHIPDSRQIQIGKGFPDWVIAGPHGVLFREGKDHNEDTRPEQDEWLSMLHLGGADARVWRRCSDSDLIIKREIARIACPEVQQWMKQ